MIFRSSRQVLIDHLARLRSSVTLRTRYDRDNAAALERKLMSLEKQHKIYTRARIFVFILLYASVASAIGAFSQLLGEVVGTITAIGGILGAGALSLIALVLTWQLAQLWNRMVIVYSHLVAIYEKNNRGGYSGDDLKRDD